MMNITSEAKRIIGACSIEGYNKLCNSYLAKSYIHIKRPLLISYDNTNKSIIEKHYDKNAIIVMNKKFFIHSGLTACHLLSIKQLINDMPDSCKNHQESL